MTAAIHQPDYIPYLGFFYKIFRCDIFIFLDDAQFSTSGGHDSNLIKTPQGALKLKIPVFQTLGDRINEVATKDSLNWKQRHLDAVRLNYKKAPHFDRVFDVYGQLLSVKYGGIAQLNEAMTLRFCKEAGIERKFMKSSELGLNSKREERVIDICKAAGCDSYFSGGGAAAYQSQAHFLQNGTRLVYSDYRPFAYPQLWGGFIENLSALDYFFNCGFDFDLLERL
jgi:hypothetical protein